MVNLESVPIKIAFKNSGEGKTFSDTHKLNEFSSTVYKLY